MFYRIESVSSQWKNELNEYEFLSNAHNEFSFLPRKFLHFNFKFVCSRENAALSVFNPTMSLIHLEFHRISIYLCLTLPVVSYFARSHFSLHRYDYSNIQLLKTLRNAICSISFVKWWINQIWFSLHSIVFTTTSRWLRQTVDRRRKRRKKANLLADFSWGD